MKDPSIMRINMDSKTHEGELEELIRGIIGILRKHGLGVDIINYPREGRRSVDIVANGRLIIKVSKDASEISREEIEDLKLSSKMLNSAVLIVSKSYLKEDLEPGIIMDRSDISVMDPETLDLYLSDEKVAIYYKKGQFFVKIKGEVLHRKRIERNMSMGELAEMLGISRKAVYEYEKGAMDPSIEVAQKLIDIFGEDIVERVDIHELTKRYVFSYASRMLWVHIREDPILRRMSETGIEAIRLKRTAPDILGIAGRNRAALVIHDNSKTMEDLTEKIVNTLKICLRLGCKVYTLISNQSEASAIKKEFNDKVRIIEKDRLEEIIKSNDPEKSGA
ncbi:MAG: helix-turn-helix domain-containing protein [Desulfurococcales archaeon]|nr:helix-turn-helix domain-containing protein [Desulfurococcales archaeon]